MASPNSRRDFPINFVQPPPKEIPAECPICYHVLSRPKMASCCGHSFCTACINLIVSDQKPCPLCGQGFTLADNKWLERTLNNYDVYCPHQEKGCEWKGELGTLENHVNRNPLPEKLLEGCQFQEIQCGLCQSHQCERLQMTDHVTNDCPNRDIECEYFYIGCNVKKPQQRLAVHMTEAVSVHLSLFQASMQNSLSQKDDEMDKLKEELRKQREQREQSDTKFQEMQQQLTEQIQKIERKQSHTTRHWMLILFMIVMAGGIVNAYLYQTTLELKLSSEVTNETMNNLSSEIGNFQYFQYFQYLKISHNQYLREKVSDDQHLMEKGLKELKENMKSLSSKVEIVNDNQHLTEKGLKELKENVNSLSSTFEKVSDNQHSTEMGLKGLKENVNSLSSKVEKLSDNQYSAEKKLKDTMNSLASEFERINRSQQLIEKGLNESVAKIAKFDSEIQELSDNVTQTQSTVHQLKANADTAAVASDKVRRDVAQFLSVKIKVDSIEKQMATSSEEIKKLVQGIDQLRKHLKLTQEFFY